MDILFSKKEPDIDIISFKGDLDYQASAELREKLNAFLDGEPKKIILNMSQVAYMDSSGIAAFVEISRKAKSLNAKIVFHSITEHVKNIFELAKLHLFFAIAESEDDAIQKCNS